MFFHECKQKGWPFSLIFIDSHSARIYFTSAPRDFSDTKHIYTPENWIRIHGKNGTHRIILAVYKDNNIGRTKSGLRTKFARLRLHHTFWTLDRHLNMKLRYCACVSEVITQADVRIKELVTWGI